MCTIIIFGLLTAEILQYKYTVILPRLVKSPMVAQGGHGDLTAKHDPTYGDLTI